MEKEYVVTFKSSYQISPDDFKVYNPSMKINGATTIKELDEFFRRHVKETPLEVTIIELENQTAPAGNAGDVKG